MLATVTSLPYPVAVSVGLFAVLGAVFASFLCVVAERVPAKRTLGGRSACVCGRQLRGIENIPVVAWLALRGRSRCCRAAIPMFYFLAEVLLAAWFAAAVVVTSSVVVMAGADVVAMVALVAIGWHRTGRPRHGH